MDVECTWGTAATIVDNTVDPIGGRPSYEAFWSKWDFLNDTRRMITVGYSPCEDQPDQPVESAYLLQVAVQYRKEYGEYWSSRFQVVSSGMLH